MRRAPTACYTEVWAFTEVLSRQRGTDLLTDAVFSIDKPFLRDGVVAHIAAATAVFVELPFLREATITIRSLLMLAGLSAHSL